MTRTILAMLAACACLGCAGIGAGDLRECLAEGVEWDCGEDR